MRRLCLLALVLVIVVFTGLGCTAEDKRQWQEALREWRGDNIRFGSRDHPSP
jgi:hypothetical protein